MRLDVVLSEKFKLSRNRAQALIVEGLVSVNGIMVKKSAFEVGEDEIITLQEEKKIHWVSRSAGKLDGFLLHLRSQNQGLQIVGASCLDVGSSTWGFTQVLLEYGARHVDAVDVGTDQLHPSLKDNPKVTSYEQTDIRKFPWSIPYDIIVCDASFISLQNILPSILTLTTPSTTIIVLWKPQFEVGREHLRKTWVPKDEKIITLSQKAWEEYLERSKCEVLQKMKSSVIGEAGNQEWLYMIQLQK